MTSLNSMKHYMPCVVCRHNAKIKYDSNGNGYTEKFSFCDNCEVKMLFNRLKEYEDLEEQGLLLKLPCKVGDSVYEVQELRKRIQPYTIISIHVSKCGFLVGWEIKDGKGVYSNINGFCDYAIGKTVFLTQAEAEAKLKELEGSEDK